MRKIFYIIILFSFSRQTLGQNIDIKKILTDNKFTVIKSKKSVPFVLLNKLGVDSIQEIANPHEKWCSGCVRDGKSPIIKLNWAAKTANDIWFICLSFGGSYTGPATYVYLFLAKDKIDIKEKYNLDSFRTFKNALLNNKIEKF